jgi:flagellin-like protein
VARAAQTARPSAVRSLAPVALRLAPGLLVVGLFVLWAEHDGGYDNDTWYWGALVTLALLAATLIEGAGRIHLTRAAKVSVGLFSLYVAWSYASMAWAAAPGVALQGSNRALLYLLVFVIMLVLPWSAVGARLALVGWAVGVGGLAVWVLVRLVSGADIQALISGGRLASPTGYNNAAAALFTMGLLVSIGLATQRGLPGVVRGLLLGLACAELQVALFAQSRGWLFTLPIVAVLVIVLAGDRLRLLLFAAVPAAGVAAILPRLLRVYESTPAHLGSTAASVGQAGLLVAFAAFVIGTLLAWVDWLGRERTLSSGRRRIIGVTVAVAVAAGVAGSAVAATHGHPVRFVVRQWNGFSQQHPPGKGSHFLDVGSGRYDFWRVALDAFVAHPVGGLGQDNFDDYYIVRGRSGEEPTWTHSLELRLLAHTGAVGFILFAGFIAAAVAVALRARRGGDPGRRTLVAIALIPLVVWLVHGSIDWFWEMPALSGPALGFLGVACALGRADIAPGVSGLAESPEPARRAVLRRGLTAAGGAVLLIAMTLVLALPYLATRKISIASDLAGTDPAAALADLRQAASLDPFDADPTRMAGFIALQSGRNQLAASLFARSLAREPGDWFAYLGSGLAASALGHRATARRDYAMAEHINHTQYVDYQALHLIDTPHPLTTDEALKLVSFVQ